MYFISNKAKTKFLKKEEVEENVKYSMTYDQEEATLFNTEQKAKSAFVQSGFNGMS